MVAAFVFPVSSMRKVGGLENGLPTGIVAAWTTDIDIGPRGTIDRDKSRSLACFHLMLCKGIDIIGVKIDADGGPGRNGWVGGDDADCQGRFRFIAGRIGTAVRV